MVGLVVVCHGGLGAELVKVAEVIVGKLGGVEVVSIGSAVDVDKARDDVGAAIKKVRSKEGVLIFTDMFGGTPSNLSLAFLDEDNVEVLTGANLPMLVKFANHRDGKGVRELADLVKDGGVKSIIVASDMLKQKVKK